MAAAQQRAHSPQSFDASPVRLGLNPVAASLMAGWGAGIMEALACHPLDTIKVNMQVAKTTGTRAGFLNTAATISSRQGLAGLYAGLTSVLTFIGPKMATRFASFEAYKSGLAGPSGTVSAQGIFLAALSAGVTEAIVVVTPMEVVKIRLQSGILLSDGRRKYQGVFQTMRQIVAESGLKGLYSGFGLTALRQGTNQAANLSVYTYLKGVLQRAHTRDDGFKVPIASWQTSLIGLVAGAAGPCTNAPIDTIKTRLQRSPPLPGQSSMQRVRQIVAEMLRREGASALYKGILPRVLRVGPGQAVAYTCYEKIKSMLL